MHPHLSHAQQEALNQPLDMHFITLALIHSLGMGAVLMAVTALVDHRQQNRDSPQANVQNASNILFMCVAIATVIILVGNNVARAFALGAAIALIRFKMKLGESSSGSGLLFAILCGMASAVGLHSVGWTLAIGYSLVQMTLSLVISRLATQSPAPILAATALDSSETSVSEDSPGHPASPIRPHLMSTRVRTGKNKDGVTLMGLAALFVLGTAGSAPHAHATADCTGTHRGTSVRLSADHAYRASAVAIYGEYLPYSAAECQFAETPILENAFKIDESFAIRCAKDDRKGAASEQRWQKSLVGVRFELDGGGFFRQDSQRVDVLLTQSVVGTLALHGQFRMQDFDYGVITDLLPNPEGRWNVRWDVTDTDGTAQSVTCEIRKI